MSDEKGEETTAGAEPVESEELIDSPWKRVVLVIFSPQRVFESLRVKSSHLDWVIPWVLSLIFTLAIVNMGRAFLQNDQLVAVTAQIEKKTGLTAEQKAAQMEQVKKGMENMAGVTRIMTNVGALAAGIAGLAIIALVMRVMSGVTLGSSLAFGNAFRIAALGSMVSLLGGIASVPLVFYFESFKQAQLSIGFLLPEGMQDSFLLKVLDFNLFTLWYLIVLCIGMAVFAKKPLLKALVPMAVLWLVYRVAATALSSGLGSLGA